MPCARFLISRAAPAGTRTVNTVTLAYPASWLAVMGADAREFAEEARMAAAVKLFEMGRFSSGQAAQLAGLSKEEFLSAARAWSVAPAPRLQRVPAPVSPDSGSTRAD